MLTFTPGGSLEYSTRKTLSHGFVGAGACEPVSATRTTAVAQVGPFFSSRCITAGDMVTLSARTLGFWFSCVCAQTAKQAINATTLNKVLSIRVPSLFAQLKLVAA